MPQDNLSPLRSIEGFPIGEDEDLHALSDPPNHTAYPNPHLAEFIQKWGKPYDEATDTYHREPYVSDVSEGKKDPIYNAHAYHTKVPYKAIIPFIEHYAQLGDIIFDGFCGTGMTGIAAQMVGRRAILCDLSPAATFIAYNYNTPVDILAFEREAKQILEDIEAECSWMYETRHVDGRVGQINYTVWSDVFVCPYCKGEIIFWDVAADAEEGQVEVRFSCSSCRAQVTKRDLSYATELVYDSALKLEIERNRQVPVLIHYSVGEESYEKRPDVSDIALIQKIENSEIPYWYPSYPMMFKGSEWGDQWRSGYHTGITHTHHFYTRRNLWILAAIWHKLPRSSNHRFWMHAFTGAIQGLSKLQRFRPKSTFPNMILSGTLYIGSITREWNVYQWFEGKIGGLRRSFKSRGKIIGEGIGITTQSTSQLLIPDASVDYIFTDPPFGDNLAYSELNFIWEAWLKVFTNNNSEAIISRSQGKTLDDYRGMMTYNFSEMYRILKPGHWITVVFHNSKASVWNAIQESLARAGFLVAQVTAMDKRQGSFNQMTAVSAVKNDLIINAYKPRAGFVQRLLSLAGQGLEADFVRQHLTQLPLAANIERSREMLYSKYLAYYVQHGYQVAYNGEQFYRALSQWGLVEKDGYWFSDEAQANEYEERQAKIIKSKTVQAVLFISDERSARQWLWHFLSTSKDYDEIYTAFVRALQTPEDQIPEPRILLEEGFIQTGDRWRRPDALTQQELEARRQARLIRQFEEYLSAARAGQRLKEVRKEALVAGFTEAYRAGRFQDILTVGKRLDKRLLEDNPDLFDFVDIAEAKVE